MNKEMRERILALFREVRRDRKYAALSKEYGKLRENFERLVDRYPVEEQDILWAFVCHSEDMNWRMLEWLCERYDIEV
ncbi:MAG: hypothetical protein IJE58_05975 [Oscillospiraceae bacterium]|nr:hypothetical protein [Oscillospiraceae bacterium]